MHCKVGLIVTGAGERDFLPSLFRSLTARADCSFSVLRRIGQRDPVRSVTRRLAMVGSGRIIPTQDELEIGLPTRRWLRDHPDRYLVLVDDLEGRRRADVGAVYGRYRQGLDTMLSPQERGRAAVHFLANMLEAYYFADCAAVNRTLGRIVLAGDHSGDVEQIPNPKGDLRSRVAGFDERRHGALIVQALDLDHVLGEPKTCGFLRSLFGWLVETALQSAQVFDADIANRYCLPQGVCETITRSQAVS